MTNNHNYNTPEEGTTNWHIPLNENFEQLSIDVEIRGSEAEKGEYEPKAGAKYEAIDSGAVYHGEGESWVLADRQLGQLEAERVSTKQLQQDGPRIVSPSINSGYNSLQTAINDAAQGVSGEIWLTEDIEENIFIPTDGVDWNNGLAIRGLTGSRTIIKDAAQDGTYIIEVDPNSRIEGLTLQNLRVEPSGQKTRAFSFAPGEEGHTRGPSLSHLTIRDCRFEAPSVIGLSFFTQLENSIFRSMVKHNYNFDADPSANHISGTKELSTAMMWKGGNQHASYRCNWVTKTGDTRYGALWLASVRSQYHSMAHFNLGVIPGQSGTQNHYDTGTTRDVGALLIDGSGDLHFDTPYIESGGDFGLVNDKLISKGATDGLLLTNDRLQSVKVRNRINGLAIESPQISFELDVDDGIAAPGSYIRDPLDLASITGDHSRYVRFYQNRPQGWDIQTPPTPNSTGSDASFRNNSSVPALVYQSGGEGITVKDFEGNKKTLPNNSGPIILGLQEEIWFETNPPEDWEWYGME